MIKRFIAFIGLLMVITVALGCVQTQEEIPKPQSNETNKTNLTNVTKPEVIIIGPCNSTNRTEVDLCLFEKGMCEHIASIALRDECYYKIHNCSEILNVSKREECSRNLALAECEKSNQTNLCKALATNDVKYCGANIECVMEYVKNKKDVSACDELSDYQRVACRALAKEKYDVCYSELKYEASIKECLKLFSFYSKKDGDICSRLTSVSYRDDCYKYIAEASLNYSNCILIEDYMNHVDCIINIAKQIDDPTVCEKIRLAYYNKTRENYVYYCIKVVSNTNYKPQYCSKVRDPRTLWECFGNSIVQGKTKKEDCDQISDDFEEWKSLCYQTVGNVEK